MDLGIIGMLALLLACQLAGEVLTRATNLPVPGPVVGMLLMLGGLLLLRRVPRMLERTTRGLLDHLSLLFVPAGVGVILHLDLLRAQWLPIAASIAGSTILAMLVTAGAMLATESVLARVSRAGSALRR